MATLSAMIELLPWAMLANGPACTKARVVLQRLHEVGLERVLEQHGHGAGGMDVLGRERLAVVAVAEGDAAEALAQVLELVARPRMAMTSLATVMS